MNEHKAPEWQDHSRELFHRLVPLLERPRAIAELASELGEEPQAFLRFVADLIHRGIVVEIVDGVVALPGGPVEVGYVAARRNRQVVIPMDRKLPILDLAHNDLHALAGDRVLFEVQVAATRRRGFRGANERQARVLRILEARPAEMVGIYDVDREGRHIVQFRGLDRPGEVVVRFPSGVRARPGQLVRIRLARSSGRYEGYGEFVEFVSDIEAPNEDVESISALYGLPTAFPPEVEREIRHLPEDPTPESMRGRLDLTHLFIVTIDPTDAKDHDDAISVEQLGDGIVRAGIHIADVSAYVRPDTALGLEAFERATSTYLPGKTIPMLPEKLSAGLCSLVEGRTRLTKSCFLTYDRSGRLLRSEVYPSFIKVGRFLNYHEVLAFLEGRESLGPKADELVRDARKLADALLARRLEGGSLRLSIDRPHLVIDDEGGIAEIEIDKDDPAHNLIEEFMLAANQAVASFMIERHMPYIGRIHPEPDIQAEEEFAEFCQVLGLGGPDFSDPRRMQMFLDGLEGRPGKAAIHLAMLKSLKQAVYDSNPGLHYALGFHEYTHFTSPIRRLCDLTVHQLLDLYWQQGGVLKREFASLGHAWLDGQPIPRKPLEGARIKGAREWRITLPAIARHATDREIRSSKAEMEAVQLKLLRLVLGRIGEELDGTVTHIRTTGAVIQLDQLWVEGTLSYANLSREWVTARKFWAEYSQRGSLHRLRVGDRLRVVIEDVDLGTRTLRLRPPESASSFGAGARTPFVDYRKQGKAKGKSSGSRRAGGAHGGARSGAHKKRKRAKRRRR